MCVFLVVFNDVQFMLSYSGTFSEQTRSWTSQTLLLLNQVKPYSMTTYFNVNASALWTG
jgi:hypothetical protein